MKRIVRLVKLLELLPTLRDVDRLAATCHVSRRTILRDLQTLRKAGVMIRFDRDSRTYSLKGGFAGRPSNLTSEEGIAIVSLVRFNSRERYVPLMELAELAADKLAARLSEFQLNALREQARWIGVLPQPTRLLESKRAVYEQLLQAVFKRQVLAVSYRPENVEQPYETRFRPYSLVFRIPGWYVVGRSSRHHRIMIFEINRVETIEALPTTYAVPRHYSVDRILKTAWRVHVGSGSYLIELQFSRQIAPLIAEIKWHPAQRLFLQEDGSLIFRVRLSALDEIVWWILSFGNEVEVLGPPRLRRFVVHRALNMARLYETGSF